jgi:hypothetical protein
MLKLSVSANIIGTIFSVNVWRGLEAFTQNKGLWDEMKPLLDAEGKRGPAVLHLDSNILTLKMTTAMSGETSGNIQQPMSALAKYEGMYFLF